jgi:hypothetical protein
VVHKPHDRFAKESLKGIAADFGTVETEREVSGEVRTIDVVFFPDPARLEALQGLGLLGRILSRPCGIEFFRNPVPAREIGNCRDKGADLRAELERSTQQRGVKLRSANLPMLWIISPTLSERLQREFGMVTRPEWGDGIYFLPKHDRTAIVAIHRLPVTVDTLHLRLWGRGKVQANAVQDLLALPKEHPHRRSTLQHLSALQVSLRMQQNKSRDLWEVVMNLKAVYEKWEAETIAEGKKEGKKETRLEIARRLLTKQMPLAEIAELTDLTIEQIQELKNPGAAVTHR